MDVKTPHANKNNRVVLVFFFLVFGIDPTSPSLAGTQELKTEFQDVQPKYIKTKTGFKGICVDIMEELQKGLNKHGLSIGFPKDFTPPKRIRSNLTEGITDLHCGAARSKAREKIVIFSRQPLYAVKTVVVGKSDETVDIRSMDDLIRSQASVSSVFGTNTQRWLTAQKGLALGSMPQESVGGLSMVENGRIRFFVYHDIGIFWLMKKLRKESLFKVQPAVLRHYSHWMIYSPHLDQSVKQLIEDELQKLHKSGAIKTITDFYRFDFVEK